jgi:tetratricopeptide (TPR) repeat protein
MGRRRVRQRRDPDRHEPDDLRLRDAVPDPLFLDAAGGDPGERRRGRNPRGDGPGGPRRTDVLHAGRRGRRAHQRVQDDERRLHADHLLSAFARHAAALPCGAAAVHSWGLAAHAGLVTGVSSAGAGRALLFAFCAAPALLVALAAWDRAVGLPWFLAGACVGQAFDEWFLLPALGWTWTTAVWCLPAAVAVAIRRRTPEGGSPAAPGLRHPALACGAALALGAGLAFGLALLRPFLFQHVTGTRHGLRIAVLTGLAGLLTGSLLGQALKGRLPRLGVAFLGTLLAAAAAATVALLLPRSSAGLAFPFASGAWTFTWWGRSWLASWALLGFPTVAFGVLLVLVDRRRLLPFLVAGAVGGTFGAERVIVELDRDREAFRQLADDVARHPPLQSIEAASIDADGIWTRYRTRTLLEIESIGFWQAAPMERGSLWQNLERAEVEAGPDALRSFGFLASGHTLRDTVESLRHRRKAHRVAAFADPRAMTAAGLRSLLATWRESLDDARLAVLIDGYAGPLLVATAGAGGAPGPVRERLTAFEAPIASALRGDLGRPSTVDRPVLEWLAAPEPSPFPHPRGDVMRALEDALAIEPGTARARLFRGLVLHAEAQVVRPYVVSAWDHVAVPEAEIGEYMEGLRADEGFPPLVRHLETVFEVLYQKREFAVLVRHAEEAVARRPDVGAFHRTLGKAYHDILDFENAIEELRSAQALTPGDDEVAIELSRALGGARRWREAVEVLEVVVARHDDAAALKGLAIALLEAGETARAGPLLRDLRTRFPADVDVARALERLESGRGK